MTGLIELPAAGQPSAGTARNRSPTSSMSIVRTHGCTLHRSGAGGNCLAKEVRLQRRHASINEQEGRVVDGDERRRLNRPVILLRKEPQEPVPDFLAADGSRHGHHCRGAGPGGSSAHNRGQAGPAQCVRSLATKRAGTISTRNGRSARNGVSPATCAVSRYSPCTRSNARRLGCSRSGSMTQ